MTSLTTITNTQWATVTASIATNSSVLALLSKNKDLSRPLDLRFLVKAISASHSTATTILAILALSQEWTMIQQAQDQAQINSKTSMSPTPGLDDATNPWIVGRNRLAEFITAWEAGYLVYDTGAMLLVAHYKGTNRSHSQLLRLRTAVISLLKSSQALVLHHTLLASALLYFQTYIAAGREKGLRIFMVLFSMNASNPIMHLRWWRKKVSGRGDRRLDIALAVSFALTRFGSVYWACEAYGRQHGLGAWDAIRRQRWQCQAGTGLLTGLNAVWWLGLVKQMVFAGK